MGRVGPSGTQLADLVEEGKVRPLLDRRRLSTAVVAEAHRLLESGGTVGKVTLSW